MYNNTKNVQKQTLPSSCNKVRRQNSGSNSPEFEFWMVRNPSCPKPNIVSADKLFVNGVLLPLDHMDSPDPNPQHVETRHEPDTDLSPSSITAESSSLFSTSKRWRDIFKKSEKKSTKEDKENNNKNKKKRDKKSHVGLANTTATAELNINIWPFSRSRSAGKNTARPRLATSRKVSSAPCSRSNSAGESKSRDWPSSPGRVGVHLGRSSPVWQVRRANGIRNSSSGSESAGCVKKDGKTAAKVLNLKVPICVGYRHSLSCRSDEDSSLGVVRGGGGGGGCSGGTKGGGAARTSGGSDLFDIRSLFSKKVVY